MSAPLKLGLVMMVRAYCTRGSIAFHKFARRGVCAEGTGAVDHPIADDGLGHQRARCWCIFAQGGGSRGHGDYVGCGETLMMKFDSYSCFPLVSDL